MKQSHRSAKTGLYVTKAKAKSAPASTVTETTKRSNAQAIVTLNTAGMTYWERSRLCVWLMGACWRVAAGPKTYTYDPAKWAE